MPSAENLEKLARLIIRCGVGLMPGQPLVVSAPLADREFVRLVVAEAYRAGAASVSVLYEDEVNTRAKFLYGSDESLDFAPRWMADGLAPAYMSGTATLRLGLSDPFLLADIDPAKVARSSKAAAAASKPISDAIMSGYPNWCVAPCASESWAKLVFPNLPTDDAVEKLWDVIFRTTRADQPDPIAAWERHVEQVRRAKDWLNSRRFHSLHFRGPGTDLTVGLAEGHVWGGVESETKNGAVCSPNIPTEEVFTMPHADRVEGVVRSTKPLSLRGQLVDGIEVTFEAGKVAHLRAETGEAALQKLVETDEGASRLGEVALVPHSSPISQTGLLFFSTLFDENAACHIALGRAYGDTMEGFEALTPAERRARGANDSLIHVDWMIGSGETTVTGVTADGDKVPVMEAGEWVFDRQPAAVL